MMTRQSFIRSGTAVVLGGMPFMAACSRVTSSPKPNMVGTDHLPIKTTKNTELLPAINVYSFATLLLSKSKSMSLFEVCDFCAQLNAKAVDLTAYFFPGYPKVPSDAYINQLKRHVSDLGIAISGTGVRNDFATRDKSVREAGIELTKQWVEVAAKLGAPVIRVFAGELGKDSDQAEAEKWTADATRTCAESGKAYNVTIGLQNHGDLIKNADTHLKILQMANHKSCGAIVDTGYYLTQDPYQDIARMAPHAVNWQVKETVNSKSDGPPTDFEKLITIIKQSPYRGYVPIETLKMSKKNYDPLQDVTTLFRQLEKAIAKAAS